MITCDNGPLQGQYLTLQPTQQGYDGYWTIMEVYLVDGPNIAPGSDLEDHFCYRYGVDMISSVPSSIESSTTKNTMRACQEHCQTLSDCVSFLYKPNESTCYPKSVGAYEDANFERDRLVMAGPRDC